MPEVGDQLRRVADSSGFSGAVRAYRNGVMELDTAFGLADRAHGIAAATTTRFAIASGSKAFTALAVMRLVETAALQLTTPVRNLLGDDLELIDDRVTIEHLLAHRSGIGDYLDEHLIESSTDYVMTRPVHELTDISAFMPMLDGHEQRFEPGTKFVCLGFWLHATNDTVLLEGADAGVSFRAAHRPSTKSAFTVLSNWSDGAWPVARLFGPLIED